MRMRYVVGGLAALLVAAGTLSMLAPATAAAAPPRPAYVVTVDSSMPAPTRVQSQDSLTSRVEIVRAAACAVRALPALDTMRLVKARPVTAVDVRTPLRAVWHRPDWLLTGPLLIGMTALAGERNTMARSRTPWSYAVGAAKKIYRGALTVVAVTGYAQGGTTAATHIAIGRATETVDNSAGAAGDLSVTVERGVFQFANSAAADLIGIPEIGKSCYIVDDQTVAKTDGGATRSIAGVVRGVDAGGVWVEVG